ncbi:MAG: CvpA family protein [Arenicellales bacterium]
MNLAWIDIAVIAFFAISILIGIYRGFVKEILSLGSWVLAALLAFKFGEQAAVYVKPYITQAPLDLAVAYVGVFLISLVAFSIISHIIGQIFSASGMSGIDRSLGSVFGALRAAAVISILILVARFMALDQQQWWLDSEFLVYFEPIVEWIKTYLPEDILKKIEA